MGHELYRMIMDGAPAEWTDAMRVVALAIADDARDPSQGMPEGGGWPWSRLPLHGYHDRDGRWHDGLAEKTGKTERSISRALTDLARGGYEMREEIGKLPDGRPLFTAPGRAMRFRVPILPPRRSPATVARIGGRSIERSPHLAATVARYGDLLTSVPLTTSSPQKSCLLVTEVGNGDQDHQRRETQDHHRWEGEQAA